MPSLLDYMVGLEKTHDYFGKAEDLYKNVQTVHTAAKIDPKDPKALKQLVGITDKETAKLLATLNKRAAATEAAAKSSFPAIPSTTTAAWSKWFKAAQKGGLDSKETLKYRQAYLKALLAYDLLLRERISYCDILIKNSGQQIKIYKGLVDVHAASVKICMAVIVAPSGMSTAPQVEAMNILLKFQTVPAPANRIWKAHEKIITLSKTQKAAQEKVKKANDLWIRDMQAKNLRDVVKKALSALGVAV